MPLISKDRVKEVASNKPNASTAFNLADSAPAGFQSFDSAYATGETMECMATNGSAWESFIGTFTAGTPDTLARTELLASSTGSAIDWSAGGDVTVFATSSSKELNSLHSVSRRFIAGLNIVWNSATSITVKAGAAYVEEADKVIALAADQTISPTLSASAWHYIYLKSDGTCEVVSRATAAPVSYFGDAMSKNVAGQKWRMLGQFRTNASSQILKFVHNPELDQWVYPLAADTAVYRVLSNGKAATSTQVSLSAFMPPESINALLKLSNTDASQQFMLGDGDTTVTSTTVGFFAVSPTVRSSGSFPTNVSQQVTYIFGATPTGGAFIDILGYFTGR